MLIKLYKSSLCPRCYLAKKRLYKIAEKNPDIQIEEIDVLTNLKIAKNDDITMIPALKIGENKLSAVFLGEEEIENFITKCIQETKRRSDRNK